MWRPYEQPRVAASGDRAILCKMTPVTARIRAAAMDRWLELEQAGRVLGPAHRAWRGNSVEANLDRWTGWDWSALGEEWNASSEWKQALIDDVLLTTIPPGGTVLEIGPGGGRWSEALAARAERLVLVDVT